MYPMDFLLSGPGNLIGFAQYRYSWRDDGVMDRLYPDEYLVHSQEKEDISKKKF